MKNIYPILLACTLTVLVSFMIYKNVSSRPAVSTQTSLWQVQSIDTVKYSRDLAREKLNDPTFDKEIEAQVASIAATGATHVSLGTPYDSEFVPYLTRWVSVARKYKLNVWFRGNMSGWEEWFNYTKISREEHTKQIVAFVEDNSKLFEDGDVFTSCPECENGGNGDPRQTGDVAGFRSFLVSEYGAVKQAFLKINKKVIANYYSMNGDVAGLVMDKDTTLKLDGIVTIDHYVKSSNKLISGIDDLADKSGGKIVLGEWGAPIPDINGEMEDSEQASFVGDALRKLALDKNVVAINYWANKGSSTALWNGDNSPRKVVSILTSYYKPMLVKGVVENEVGNGVYGAVVKTNEMSVVTGLSGEFSFDKFPIDGKVEVSASGYNALEVSADKVSNITLVKTNQNIFWKIAKWLHEMCK